MHQNSQTKRHVNWNLDYEKPVLSKLCVNIKKLSEILFEVTRAQCHGSAYHEQRIGACRAGNYALTSSVFLGLAGNFGCALHVLGILCLNSYCRKSKFSVCRASKTLIASTDFSGKQSHDIGPRSASETRRYFSEIDLFITALTLVSAPSVFLKSTP